MGETVRGAEALGRKADSIVQSLLVWGFGVITLTLMLGQMLSGLSVWGGLR